MKKITFIFSVLFIFSFLFTETHIPGGNVSGVWTFENSPYIIDGEISIQINNTLAIEPGVEVIFSGHYKFNIYGRILAEGTERDSIYFTSLDTEIGWNGLRIFDTSANVQDSSKVVYCKFENGNATSVYSSDYIGGAIACYHSSNVLINYCLFQNNTADYGGAISVYNSDILLQNSVIKNNYANYYAGGIRISDYSEIIIENVIITNNFAGIKGGGIYCYRSDPSMSGVSIYENSANYEGGGLYLQSSIPIFNAENRCNIYLNDSDIFGKDIYLHNTNVDVIVDTFTVIIPHVYFAYPLDDLTFDILNSAIEQVDQDLYVSPTGSDENSGLTADDPLKTINFAMYMILSNEENPHSIHLDEGIYAPSYGENFPIYMKRFISIMGENPQTTILNGENLTQIISSVFSDNNFSLQGITIRNGYTSWNGGGIYCNDSDIIITDVVLESNHACFRGGGIHFSGGSLTISNTSVTNNSASGRMDGSGGGICCTGSVNLNNVLINANYALINGGGILCSGSDDDQIFSNTVIIGNTADDKGGGICFSNAEPELHSVTITQNHAQYGGGISFSNSDPVFDSENRCSIYLNTASSSYSRDVFSGVNNNTVTVIVDTFTVSNPTDYYAAPIYNFTFDILHSFEDELVNSDFYVSVTGDNSNTGTTANDPLKTIGCALSKIYADSLNQNTIYLSPGIYSSETNGETFPISWNNFISLEGGSEEETILDGNNETGVMGFCYVNTASIKKITIRNSSASGIYCRYSNPDFANITITDNYAFKGGGIYCRNSSNPSFTNVTIKDNSAGSGGGIYCYDSSNPNLTNVTITGNNSNYKGGGIYCTDSSNLNLTNVTIAGNNADQNGGGIYYRYSSNLCLMNCILYNDLPQEVYFYEYSFSNEITISYSDIQGGEEGIETNGNGILNWLEGNIDEAPLFADALYHLSPTSPCIDAGNPQNIYNDPEDPDNPGFALYPAMGTIYNDMGAYGGPNASEWMPPVSVEEDIFVESENCHLYQNYPNPFNLSTTISFSTAENEENAEISIYNLKGQKVKQFSIDDGRFSIEWNGTD
ncbi:MAG TPA: T9SS type A sorting domain-containing protein, partial [Firmicutes bacterium]|nr:T9SS type A sorting domain-containing protein [Bacillota bacterium]